MFSSSIQGSSNFQNTHQVQGAAASKLGNTTPSVGRLGVIQSTFNQVASQLSVNTGDYDLRSPSSENSLSQVSTAPPQQPRINELSTHEPQISAANNSVEDGGSIQFNKKFIKITTQNGDEFCHKQFSKNIQLQLDRGYLHLGTRAELKGSDTNVLGATLSAVVHKGVMTGGQLKANTHTKLAIKSYENFGFVYAKDEIKAYLDVQDAKSQAGVQDKKSHIIAFKGYQYNSKREHATLIVERFGHKDGSKIFSGFSKFALKAAGKLSQAKNNAVRSYIAATAELNVLGFVHGDIKPENFFHKNDGQAKLGDLEFVKPQAEGSKNCGKGTSGFKPPEALIPAKRDQYSAVKHDAFALGMSLLAIREGKDTNGGHGKKLLLDGKKFKLESFLHPQTKKPYDCKGTSNTGHLQGNTLDEVIAKLLDENPTTRITAEEAMQTPFFKSL